MPWRAKQELDILPRVQVNQRRSVLRVMWLISTVVVCILSPQRAAAQVDDKGLVEPSQLAAPAPPFGAPGEVAISGTSGAGASYTSFSGSQASSLSLAFGPAVDVFVMRNLSLGLSGDISYSEIHGYGADSSLVKTTTTTFSAAVRAGVDLPITGSLAFWPRLLVGLEWMQQREQAINGSTISIPGSPLGNPMTTRSGPWAELVLPLTLHVAPHVFAGFGPSAFHEFSKPQGGPNVGGERTTVGAFLDVGGWFGGRDDTTTDATVAPVRRFGSAHDVVISNAVTAQGFWTSYTGSSSTAATIAVSPGLDYFVAEHVSIGIAVAGSYGSNTGIDGVTGGQVTSSQLGFGVGPRIGADIPISAYVSFWPMASVGLGEATYDESEGTSSNNSTEWSVTVSAYAPVLVHPTSNFFVGFGPAVSQDITHPVTYPNYPAYQNRITTVQASLIVGGVL